MARGLVLANGRAAVLPQYAATVVTAADGTATLTFPAGLFASAPIVSLSAVQTSTTQVTVAEITAVSATSVSVKTWRSAVVVFGGNASVVTAATVHVVAMAAG